MNYLCITVRWFDDRFHGKDADGEPEWPPSPLRLFQALLAGAYRRFGETDSFLASFRWLQNEAMPPPLIVAPRAQPGQPFTRFVPNNDSDKKLDRQNRLTSKTVRPTLLLDPSPIHYLWQLPELLTDEARRCANELCEIARSLVTFGWGVDMAAASGLIASEEHVKSLRGERWLPNKDMAGQRQRIPCLTTLDALIDRYKLFVERLRIEQYRRHEGGLENGCLTDLPPLDESAFRVVGYRRDRDPVKRPIAAFSILKLDASGFRPFHTVRWGRCVAGMLRHAARVTAENAGWPKEKIDSFILGHGESPGEDHKPIGPKHFAYLPLPSIERRGDADHVVTSIRRALITVLGEGGDQEITWARRHLSGVELVAKDNGRFLTDCEANNLSSHDPLALLSLLPESDKGVIPYTRPSSEWTTVTPVALPGSDEGKANKTDKLLEKMFRHAGYSIDAIADLDFQRMPFVRGAEDAKRYRPRDPHYLANCTTYHMRIRWKHRMPGPIVLGSGRFCGLGIFAAMGD